MRSAIWLIRLLERTIGAPARRSALTRVYSEEARDRDDSLGTRLVNDTIETLAHDHRSVPWGDRFLTLDKSADFNKEPAVAKVLRAI